MLDLFQSKITMNKNLHVATILLAGEGKPLFIKLMTGKIEKTSLVASTLPTVQVDDLVTYIKNGSDVIVLDKLDKPHLSKPFEQHPQQLVLHWGRIRLVMHQQDGISAYREEAKYLTLSATRTLTAQTNALYFQSKNKPLTCASPTINLNAGAQ